MKAADARRQGSLERKRIRQSDVSDDYSDARRHLANRLLSTLQSDTTAEPALDALQESSHKIKRLETELETLEELKVWTERLVQLQMHWVDCGVRLGGDAAVRMWNHMDKMLRRVAKESNRRQQLEMFVDELPRLLEKAATLLIQAPSLEELSRATFAPNLKPTPWDDTPTVRASVDLPYQWVPRVISGICESVEREHAAGRCRPSLVDGTRRILTVIRDHNPYAFFSVLYRPPPSNESTESVEWLLYYSGQVDSVARLLHADFDELDDLAWWMQRPDATFWRSFDRFMRCVRRLALAFHRVMIHFYAAAMRRHDKYVTVDDIAYEINCTYTAHTSFKLQSEAFGLAKWFETSKDAIFYETYAMFPEVLVYVDQWRHEYAVYEHGFAPKERSRDYEVGYHKWKASKSWLEISHQAKRIVQAWRRSGLGTRDYRPLSYQQLGRLEKDIKYRLAKITDLLYKQNLAKWSQQRYQHTRARVLMELKILENHGHMQSREMMIPVTIPAQNVQVKGSAKIQQKNAFRSPTRSRRPSSKRTKEKVVTTETQQEPSCATMAPFDVDEILKWTDDEIDSHEQETERVYKLQSSMHTALDELSLSRLVSNVGGEIEDGAVVGFAVDDLTAVRGLFANVRRLNGVTNRIVAHGEEIALHGAAEALIKRPSLRIGERVAERNNNGELEPDPADPVTELEVAVRESALGLLNLHQAIATDSDAIESAQELAQAALGLLRRAQSLGA